MFFGLSGVVIGHLGAPRSQKMIKYATSSVEPTQALHRTDREVLDCYRL